MLKSARESSISSTAQESADLVSGRKRGEDIGSLKGKQEKQRNKNGTETRCLYFF